MTSAVTISCILNTTDPNAAVGFEAWVNNNKFVDINHVQAQHPISIEIPDDDDSEHELRFILKNKTIEHTQVDEAGNIISDAKLSITDVAFDEIKLGHMLTELATYAHDFNGTQSPTTDKFHGEMGCNGTVSLAFSTPIYMWLLEHM
jgi:hypothetical protein